MNPELNAQIDRLRNVFVSVGYGLPDAFPPVRAVEGSMGRVKVRETRR